MNAIACRLCGAQLPEPFIDLGLSPLSNSLVDERDLSTPDAMYPLRAHVCERCWLVQVAQCMAPERIFRDYAYFSSFSTTWLAHVHRYAQCMGERLGLDASSLVIEVASNDGHLLSEFASAGVPVLGIEPARNIARVAIANGIPTINEFLSAESGRALRAQGRAADLLVANNVLAHVPDLHDFIAGLAALLKRGGTMTLEFPHLARMLERVEFDTIYHEHFSYFSLGAAQRALEEHGLEVVDVEELPTHGGSLRVYAMHAGQGSATPAVARLLAREEEEGLRRFETYARFAAQARSTRDELTRFLRAAADDGAAVAGYGAPAKATTLLNYCGVGTELLPYTVDRSPHKQSKYIPGVRTPIFATERIFETRPDYILILPWNIADEIREQMSGASEWGARFVVPIPSPVVVA